MSATLHKPLLVRHEVCADPLRRTGVLVGHPGRVEPQVTSLHWDGECGFQLRLLDDGPGWARMEHHEGLTIWRKGDVTARMYPTAGLTQHDHDGGFEFEVEWERRPVSNVLRFRIRSVGLRFHYQRDGADHVEGSYAVYHASRAGNFDDVHYRAGKACHLYRPWAEDAAGRRVWCDLRMPANGNGVATVTVPRWFLDDAAYPVTVDPTFGYTTAGATPLAEAAGNSPLGSLVSSLTAAAGTTVTKTTVYMDAPAGSGTASIDMGIYTIVSSLPDTLTGSVATASRSSATPAWVDATASVSLTAGTTYNIAAGHWIGDSSGSVDAYYDSVAGTWVSIGLASATLPASWTNSFTNSLAMSFYATYTVATAVVAMPRPTAMLFI